MMMKSVSTFCLLLVICWLAGPSAVAQNFEGRGRRWRGRDPFRMTDEDREVMYDHMVARYQERFTRDYELTDEQGKEVKARLETIKAEHQAYAEPLREEFNQMGQELRDLFGKRRTGAEVDRERIHQIMERMRQLREASPLMNSETVTRRVEALLPAEQVERGRARAEQRRAEMRQRWEELRERWGGRREDGRGGRGRGGGGRAGRGGGRFSRGDRWDRYFGDFKRRYQLDASQEATADSILRELKKQRDTYIEGHQEEIDAVRSIEDRDERWSAYRELTAPTEALFDHLRQRLDRILTRAQQEAGGSMPEFWVRRRPTSRPVGSATRPAAVTTRPADG